MIREIPPSVWPADAEYHREVSLGWTSSAVKLFHACPAAARRRYIDGHHTENSTEATRIGDAVHAAALTPETGMQVVQVRPKRKKAKSKRQANAEAFGFVSGPEAPTDFAAFADLLDADGQRTELHRRAAGAFWTLAQHWPGLVEIDPRRFAAHCPPEVAVAMTATDSTRVAGQYLWAPHGRSEWTAYAADLDTGVPIKCRCDRILPGRSVPLILPDLKVTHDVTPRAFFRTVRDFGYVRQLAHYRRVLRAFWGDPGLEVKARWIAVQSKANRVGRHPVIVYRCPSDVIDSADVEVLADLQDLAACLGGERPWSTRLLPGEDWDPETGAETFFDLSSIRG